MTLKQRSGISMTVWFIYIASPPLRVVLRLSWTPGLHTQGPSWGWRPQYAAAAEFVSVSFLRGLAEKVGGSDKLGFMKYLPERHMHHRTYSRLSPYVGQKLCRYLYAPTPSQRQTELWNAVEAECQPPFQLQVKGTTGSTACVTIFWVR